MNHDERSKKIGQILAKCWSDESFKKKLLVDPVATLKAEGAKMPEGITVKVTENTDKVFNLVIPAKPTDLTDADLDKVAGGYNYGGWGIMPLEAGTCSTGFTLKF